MLNYPDDFLNEIKPLLGTSFNEFTKALNDKPYKGLRINTLKCKFDDIKDFLPDGISKTPFFDNGYYIPHNITSLGNNPLHHAGAFYIQEPSATVPAVLLNPQKNDKILDLCAAPGGKSTQIAAMLDGTGLLWSNEIVKSRANILLSNIERMGIKNAVVSNCSPDLLCKKLEEFFDKILVDAPCSGEGMFRKDNDAIQHWSREHVKSCSARQLQILNSAKNALKPGGTLVYSTCTFSYEENEGVITEFLKENSDFELDSFDVPFGRSFLKGTVRIFPMDGGEGHFCARLIKKGSCENSADNYFSCMKEKNSVEKDIKKLYTEIFPKMPFGENIYIKNGKVYIIPDDMPDFDKLNVIRCGVFLGELKKGRLEPAHAAFMASRPEYCASYVNFEPDCDEILKFMHGEEIPVSDCIKGYTAVCVHGITVGFGKCSDGRLKNKYPKGLRFNGQTV